MLRVGTLIASAVISAGAAALGGTALAMLYAISDGTYDPVADDGLAAEAVPQIIERCWAIAKTSGLVLVLSLPIAFFTLHRMTRNPRSARGEA